MLKVLIALYLVNILEISRARAYMKKVGNWGPWPFLSVLSWLTLLCHSLPLPKCSALQYNQKNGAKCPMTHFSKTWAKINVSWLKMFLSENRSQLYKSNTIPKISTNNMNINVIPWPPFFFSTLGGIDVSNCFLLYLNIWFFSCYNCNLISLLSGKNRILTKKTLMKIRGYIHSKRYRYH